MYCKTKKSSFKIQDLASATFLIFYLYDKLGNMFGPLGDQIFSVFLPLWIGEVWQPTAIRATTKCTLWREMTSPVAEDTILTKSQIYMWFSVVFGIHYVTLKASVGEDTILTSLNFPIIWYSVVFGIHYAGCVENYT